MTEDAYLTRYQQAKAEHEAVGECPCPTHQRSYPDDLCSAACTQHRAYLAAHDAISLRFGCDVVAAGGPPLSPEW